eukprot:XP_013961899.1 uncharacterized protein LOC106557582 [Canis lupus familiaris]
MLREPPSGLPVASPRQNSSPARRKAINRTGGTWARKWAFGSDRGRPPFDQSVPESRITPKRESAVAGTGPGWPFSAHSAPGLSGRRGLEHDREGRHPSPRARREPRGPGSRAVSAPSARARRPGSPPRRARPSPGASGRRAHLGAGAAPAPAAPAAAKATSAPSEAWKGGGPRAQAQLSGRPQGSALRAASPPAPRAPRRPGPGSLPWRQALATGAGRGGFPKASGGASFWKTLEGGLLPTRRARPASGAPGETSSQAIIGPQAAGRVWADRRKAPGPALAALPRLPPRSPRSPRCPRPRPRLPARRWAHARRLPPRRPAPINQPSNY